MNYNIFFFPVVELSQIINYFVPLKQLVIYFKFFLLPKNAICLGHSSLVLNYKIKILKTNCFPDGILLL